MTYKVRYKKQVQKQLLKMDKKQASIIVGWIRKNLEGTENPRQFGKGLVGNHRGEWRYRIGNYRILANIIDQQVVIEILEIGHRSVIYKKRT